MRIRKSSGILLIIGSLVMIASFFFPLWRIRLEAPQYPEGLVMYIHLDKLSGQVNIINGLNHYIGMRHITEENFPELQYMKWFIAGLILIGVIAGLIRNRWVLLSWFIVFASFAAYGIYDFWKWEYEYGHNLDPNAAIKIEGMSYQPPLIGMKQLLNFTSYSYPDIGGIILMAIGTIALILVIREFFYTKNQNYEKIFSPQSVHANPKLSARAAAH